MIVNFSVLQMQKLKLTEDSDVFKIASWRARIHGPKDQASNYSAPVPASMPFLAARNRTEITSKSQTKYHQSVPKDGVI